MICTAGVLLLDSMVRFTRSCTSSMLWLASRGSAPLSDPDRHGEGSPCTSALTLHLIVICRASLYLSPRRCPSTDLSDASVTTRPPRLQAEARARLKRRFGGNIFRKSDRKWKAGSTTDMSGFIMMSSIPLTQICSVSAKPKAPVRRWVIPAEITEHEYVMNGSSRDGKTWRLAIDATLQGEDK